jgi:hypothetical protein
MWSFLAFTFAAEDLGDDARRAEDVREVKQGKKCIAEKKEHSPFLPQGEQEWLGPKEKGRPGGTP